MGLIWIMTSLKTQRHFVDLQTFSLLLTGTHEMASRKGYPLNNTAPLDFIGS